MIADHLEETFEPRRYLLDGNRPSQTARLALFHTLIQGM
jgi:hypothetical protein